MYRNFRYRWINNFFKIEKTIFENKNSLLNQEIFLLQYASGDELSFYPGKILEIENNIIKHSACTEYGSSGSPLLKDIKIFLFMEYILDKKRKL